MSHFLAVNQPIENLIILSNKFGYSRGSIEYGSNPSSSQPIINTNDFTSLIPRDIYVGPSSLELVEG